MQWRAALQSLEANWFSPLMQGLQNGSHKQVVLHGHGEGQALTVNVNGSNRFSFWRKPAPLSVLGTGDSPPRKTAT
jgi:hypothetical protein